MVWNWFDIIDVGLLKVDEHLRNNLSAVLSSQLSKKQYTKYVIVALQWKKDDLV